MLVEHRGPHQFRSARAVYALPWLGKVRSFYYPIETVSESDPETLLVVPRRTRSEHSLRIVNTIQIIFPKFPYNTVEWVAPGYSGLIESLRASYRKLQACALLQQRNMQPLWCNNPYWQDGSGFLVAAGNAEQPESGCVVGRVACHPFPFSASFLLFLAMLTSSLSYHPILNYYLPFVFYLFPVFILSCHPPYFLHSFFQLLFMFPFICDCLCGLVIRILGYRSGGPGSIPGTTRKKVVGLERGPLRLVSTTEELFDRKVAVPV
jgi:hypothetical protein